MTTSPGTTITTDLPCAHCDYNLRAQPADGTCPECGKPVADALANPLRVADPKRVEWIRFGFCLAAAVIIGWVFHQFFEISNSIGIYLGAVHKLITGFAVVLVGLLLMTRIRSLPVRHAAMGLFALSFILLVSRGELYWFGTHVYVTRYFLWMAMAGAIYCITRPLPGWRGRWVKALWCVLALYVAGPFTLRAVFMVVGPAATIGAWVAFILWPIVHVLVLMIALHATDLAQRCEIQSVLQFGRRLTKAIIALLVLWVFTFFAGLIMFNVFNITLNGIGGYLAFQSPLILLSLAEIAAAVYFVVLARRMRV